MSDTPSDAPPQPVVGIRARTAFVEEIGASRFFLTMLSNAQVAEVTDCYRLQGMATATYRAAQLSVTGWENVVDGQGQPLEWDPELGVTGNLDRLLWETCETLGTKALRGSSMKASDSKN